MKKDSCKLPFFTVLLDTAHFGGPSSLPLAHLWSPDSRSAVGRLEWLCFSSGWFTSSGWLSRNFNIFLQKWTSSRFLVFIRNSIKAFSSHEWSMMWCRATVFHLTGNKAVLFSTPSYNVALWSFCSIFFFHSCTVFYLTWKPTFSFSCWVSLGTAVWFIVILLIQTCQTDELLCAMHCDMGCSYFPDLKDYLTVKCYICQLQLTVTKSECLYLHDLYITSTSDTTKHPYHPAID